MDRQPIAAPFAVGTKVRYCGTTRSFTYDINPKTRERKEVPLCVPGMEVVISEVRPGRRGTLRPLSDENGPMIDEETGEPMLDETVDAYSVYFVEAWQGGKKQGRVIWPDSAHQWEVVSGSKGEGSPFIKARIEKGGSL